MLGAIIGDMVGSVYEHHPLKSKDFDIYNPLSRMTDDSLLTIAVAKVLLKHYPIKYDEKTLKDIQDDLIKEFVLTWKRDPYVGYGALFYNWCISAMHGKAKPYNSYGNGSAMRISPVGWIANSEEEVKILSKTVTEITHNHPEGLKGAEAVAMCIFLAIHGYSKEKIKERMIKDYYPIIAKLSFDKLIDYYDFYPTCEESVPEAIYCFLISNSLEDAIRNCIAIGGDSDTTAAMAGAIAEAYYQKDQLSKFERKFMHLLIDKQIEDLVKEFYKTINSKKFIKE